jgi:hypothetical protein
MAVLNEEGLSCRSDARFHSFPNHKRIIASCASLIGRKHVLVKAKEIVGVVRFLEAGEPLVV